MQGLKFNTNIEVLVLLKHVALSRNVMTTAD